MGRRLIVLKISTVLFRARLCILVTFLPFSPLIILAVLKLCFRLAWLWRCFTRIMCLVLSRPVDRIVSSLMVLLLTMVIALLVSILVAVVVRYLALQMLDRASREVSRFRLVELGLILGIPISALLVKGIWVVRVRRLLALTCVLP